MSCRHNVQVQHGDLDGSFFRFSGLVPGRYSRAEHHNFLPNAKLLLICTNFCIHFGLHTHMRKCLFYVLFSNSLLEVHCSTVAK
jgi:hypothetical protein